MKYRWQERPLQILIWSRRTTMTNWKESTSSFKQKWSSWRNGILSLRTTRSRWLIICGIQKDRSRKVFKILSKHFWKSIRIEIHRELSSLPVLLRNLSWTSCRWSPPKNDDALIILITYVNQGAFLRLKTTNYWIWTISSTSGLPQHQASTSQWSNHTVTGYI